MISLVQHALHFDGIAEARVLGGVRHRVPSSAALAPHISHSNAAKSLYTGYLHVQPWQVFTWALAWGDNHGT